MVRRRGARPVATSPGGGKLHPTPHRRSCRNPTPSSRASPPRRQARGFGKGSGGHGHLCSGLARAAHSRGRRLGRPPHTSADSAGPRAASAETGRLVGRTSEVYVRVPSLPVTWRALLHNRFPLRRKRKHLKILSFLKNLLFFESLRNSLNKTIRVNLCGKRLKWLISNDRKPSSVPSCPLRGPEK